MTRKWTYRPGELARDGWGDVVDRGVPGWRHTALRIADLDRGPVSERASGRESIILPLTGECEVRYSVPGAAPDAAVELRGRASVFDGPADALYLPIDAEYTLTGHGRVSVSQAYTDLRLPVEVIRRESVPVELRGSGNMSRQVHNFGTPARLRAGAIIACEVLTPGGCWSSYPTHKHDRDVPGVETALEEIYYFEVEVERGLGGVADASARAVDAGVEAAGHEADPFALFATYPSDRRPIEISAMVRTGDIALVPYGYHGPVAAAPGYDAYYLNVMAGAGEREWLIQDDPAHGWLRETWDAGQIDARLPFGG
ncbi:5-deoxy-glucuronate isomerase [Pseudoclavibacter sp. CFCC 14310]|uniref:5-deoxy-glucuronate isomerase n=1 Tax=Pseudoclavibacter sp. CFCC 14310 TaxID=2615180 RepID=UPI0013017337|nr:5-deoxy-glucuronate isomerase [Pseudoclavibacter sp. CFCC 14310]KAB1644340.1 5-deoxy-glucuronate isomerase [Pseudoclavibacter sp. CFCC 14310]